MSTEVVASAKRGEILLGYLRDQGVSSERLDAIRVPAGIDLNVGTQLQARTADGGLLPITVVEVNEASVTVDANHPLAGQDLVFDVELVDIVRAA